jgi:BirA family transcriptional regulator, biotin operon repressor / biotin---[acetyl-CoA-carboxylase] ligase
MHSDYLRDLLPFILSEMTEPDDTFTTREGPKGTRFAEIRTFPLLDSTNRYLRDYAVENYSDGLVVIAEQQTAGRGRHGRVWDAKPGASLLLSVLLQPRDVANAQRMTNAMALAVTDACKIECHFNSKLKWPNDVIVETDDGYRKLAGILSELVTHGEEIVGVVIGVGVNLNWAGGLPEALKTTAVSADEVAGRPIDVGKFTNALLHALNERLARPSWLMQSYRQRCATLGEQVNVIQGESSFTAMALDVDDDGALLLRTDEGEERVITAGDVTHVRSVL